MSAERHFVPAKPVLPARLIAASFALGVGVMAAVGLVAPTIVMGGLSMRSAAAETMAQHQQLIAPLDVRAINAQLAQAQTEMDAARRTTDPMVDRLERLAHD